MLTAQQNVDHELGRARAIDLAWELCQELNRLLQVYGDNADYARANRTQWGELQVAMFTLWELDGRSDPPDAD